MTYQPDTSYPAVVDPQQDAYEYYPEDNGDYYGAEEYYDERSGEPQPEYYDDTTIAEPPVGAYHELPSADAVADSTTSRIVAAPVSSHSHDDGYRDYAPRIAPPRIPRRSAATDSYAPDRSGRPLPSTVSDAYSSETVAATSAAVEATSHSHTGGMRADALGMAKSKSVGMLRPDEVKAQRRYAEQPKPSKISDDASIPRVATVNQAVVYESKATMDDGMPPSSLTPCISKDCGNAIPRYVRMTLYNVPHTTLVSDRCCLTMGAVVQPFANPGIGEEPIPVVNMGTNGPIRCDGCRGYLNPNCKWKDAGRNWVCNLCGLENECPSHYRCALDGNGVRRDRNEKPELHKGSVDFVAPAEIQSQLKQNPGIVFVIDVSSNAYSRGLVQVTVQNIRDTIYTLRETVADEMRSMGMEPFEPETTEGEEDSKRERSSIGSQISDATVDSDALEIKSDCKLRIGFITYGDCTVHFHSLLDGGSLNVITQVDDPFVAIPIDNDILVPLMCSDSRYTAFDALLERVVAICDPKKGKLPSSAMPSADGSEVKTGCVTAAIACASQILEKSGGRIVAIMSELNRVGVGPLKNREKSEVYNTTKELALMSSANVDSAEYYEELMQQLAANFISCDLFAFSLGSGYLDLSTLATLCRSTGGQLYYYFGAEHIAFERFAADIEHNVSRYQVFNGIMAVRVSRGLEIAEYIGSLILTDLGGEVQVPVFSADWNVALRFGIHEKLDSFDTGGGLRFCSVQLAFLYTSIYKNESRIRLHNVCLPVVRRVADVFRAADMDAVLNFSLKQLCQELVASSLVAAESSTTGVADIRKAIVDACASILYAYRRFCAAGNPARQLVLPEALKLLPLFTLGIAKSSVLKDYLTSDQRMAEICRCLAQGTATAVRYVHPSVYAIAPLPKDESGELQPAVCVDSESSRVFLPMQLKATRQSLQSLGLYVCQSRDCLYVCVGQHLAQSCFEQAFVAMADGSITLRSDFDDGNPLDVGYQLSLLIDELSYDQTYRTPLKVILCPDCSPSAMHLLSSEQTAFLDVFVEDAGHVSVAHHGEASDVLPVCKMSYTDFLVHCHKQIRGKFATGQV